MTLQAVIDAVGGVCSTLVGADQVLTVMPPRLPDDRCFLVWVDPGPVTMTSHKGRSGGSVYQAEDDIHVDFHIKAAKDAGIEHEPEVRAMLALFRNAIISALQDTALEGTIFAFRGLTTESYGVLTYWNNDSSFGFQTILGVTHGFEVTGGS